MRERRKKVSLSLIFILNFIFFFVISFFASCKNESGYKINTKNNGMVFGTSYSIIYGSQRDFKKQFDSLFFNIKKSLSTYDANSDISKLNRNEYVKIDSNFINVFQASKEIFKETEGFFDPTIGSIVNIWGFGSEEINKTTDSLQIDSLMISVGFNKVLRDDYVISKPVETLLDFNAIAKGYGVDVIGEFLESKNINNYLVEIGGEIRCKGRNIEKKSTWKVGIEKPNFENKTSVLKIISLKDESMATSGTYRKFKIDEQGNRFSHIINVKTGYPSKTNLLSVSVITKDCMRADAYATAFKAMGIEKVKAFLSKYTEIKAFLIFENENKQLEALSLNGFPSSG